MQPSIEVSLRVAVEQQRAAFDGDPFPSLATRRDRVQRVRHMTRLHARELEAAISQDFGHRSRHETALTDVFTVQAAALHTIRHLPAWMAWRRMPTALHYRPGSNWLLRQPLGVVGVVSPWNYPYYLAMAPALAALAAGNRVLIKPSELTPATSALMQRMVSEHFSPQELQVVPGDADVGRAFTALPLDHLFFTGSTAVGRAVAQAAARNLVPVTLELGGKSPALIDRSADIDAAARSLAFGKLLNAGQTCVAPDYVLAPREKVQELAAQLQAHARRLYPRLGDNPDYTSIATPGHVARLQGLLADAQALGARAIPTHDEAPQGRKMVPHLLLDVNDGMAVMREEIFGPLLPILAYDKPEEALAYIRNHARPLAMYWFGRDGRAQRQALEQTHAGGVTINDCIWHLGQEDQPFGGVGASGMGAYHGEWGFQTFSKDKPVFVQSRLSAVRLLLPPYGRVHDKLAALLTRFVG